MPNPKSLTHQKLKFLIAQKFAIYRRHVRIVLHKKNLTARAAQYVDITLVWQAVPSGASTRGIRSNDKYFSNAKVISYQIEYVLFQAIYKVPRVLIKPPVFGKEHRINAYGGVI